MGFFSALGGLFGHAVQPYANAFGGLLPQHAMPTAGAMYASGPDGPIMTHPADVPGLLSMPHMDAPPPAANTPMGFVNNVLGPATPQHAPPPMMQAPDMSQPTAYQNMAGGLGAGQGQPQPGFRPLGLQSLSGWG